MSKPLPKLTSVTATQSILDKIGEKYTIEFDGELDDTWNDFHIKECPGWRFGLWSYMGGEKNRVDVNYFCQHEQKINKFKPSWSYIKKELHVYDEDGFDHDGFYICDITYVLNSIEFIHKHPIRAWAEDYYGYMNNCIYVPGCEIFFQWLKYKFRRFKDKVIKKFFDKLSLHWVKQHIIPYINEYAQVDDKPIHGKARIFDYGAYNDYEIIYVVDDDCERPHGFYDWFTDEDFNGELSKEFKELCLKYAKIAESFKVYWLYPFNYSYQYLYEREIPYEIASEVQTMWGND